MKNNPFTELIGFMQEEGKTFNPPSILLGEVTEVKKDGAGKVTDLKIKIGELEIDKDNLLVADYLLSGYERQYKNPTPAKISAEAMSTEGYNPHTHDITELQVSDGIMQYIDTLSRGNVLAILPTEDRQTFIVMCKVVSL